MPTWIQTPSFRSGERIWLGCRSAKIFLKLEIESLLLLFFFFSFFLPFYFSLLLSLISSSYHHLLLFLLLQFWRRWRARTTERHLRHVRGPKRHVGTRNRRRRKSPRRVTSQRHLTAHRALSLPNDVDLILKAFSFSTGLSWPWPNSEGDFLLNWSPWPWPNSEGDLLNRSHPWSWSNFEGHLLLNWLFDLDLISKVTSFPIGPLLRFSWCC